MYPRETWQGRKTTAAAHPIGYRDLCAAVINGCKEIIAQISKKEYKRLSGKKKPNMNYLKVLKEVAAKI